MASACSRWSPRPAGRRGLGGARAGRAGGPGAPAPRRRPRRGGALDDALDKLSALVVTRFRLARAAAELRARGVDTRDLVGDPARARPTLRDLRGAIMRARMISVAELLERVPLVVRGLGRATGKQVRLDRSTPARPSSTRRSRSASSPRSCTCSATPSITRSRRPPSGGALGKPEEGVVTGLAASSAPSNSARAERRRRRPRHRSRAAWRQAGAPRPRATAALLDLITRPGCRRSRPGDEAPAAAGIGHGHRAAASRWSSSAASSR